MDREKWFFVGCAFSLLEMLVVIFSFSQGSSEAVFSCIGAVVAVLALLVFWVVQARRGFAGSHFATVSAIVLVYAIYVILFASAYQSAHTLGSPIVDGNAPVDSFGEFSYFGVVTGSTLGWTKSLSE